MKCLICGGESAGEVCNQCIRLEKIIFQKEWSFKAGLIGKAEDLRVAVSNLRISGRLPMSDNPKALKTRVDNVSHYLLNVKSVEETTYSGKKAIMVTIENPATKFIRYLYLPNLDDMAGLTAAINDAKSTLYNAQKSLLQQSIDMGGNVTTAELSRILSNLPSFSGITLPTTNNTSNKTVTNSFVFTGDIKTNNPEDFVKKLEAYFKQANANRIIGK